MAHTLRINARKYGFLDFDFTSCFDVRDSGTTREWNGWFRRKDGSDAAEKGDMERSGMQIPCFVMDGEFFALADENGRPVVHVLATDRILPRDVLTPEVLTLSDPSGRTVARICRRGSFPRDLLVTRSSLLRAGMDTPSPASSRSRDIFPGPDDAGTPGSCGPTRLYRGS